MNTSLFSDIGSADESGFGVCGDNVYRKTELFEFPQYTRISYPARWDEKESFYERIVRLLRAKVLTCEGIPFEHNEKYFLDLKKALIPTV